MEEQDMVAPPRRWSDFRLLALLVLLAAGMRVWQIRNTEVTSRDSVGYVRIAWRLEHTDFPTAVRTASQHPGYPLTLLAISVPLRRLLPEADLPSLMQLSAQLASALAGVLLVLPIYFLGRELFDRRVAFWSALLFQCLPTSGRLLADGLSDPLFLLLAVTALTLAVRSLRTGSVLGFTLTGLTGGLAYLTRPEGAVVPVAAGLTLLGLQAVRRWRQPWGRVLRCGAGLSAATLAVALPFMLLIGGVTVKLTANKVMGVTAEETPRWAPPEDEAALRRSPPAAPGAARSLAVWSLWWYEQDFLASFYYLWPLKAVGLVLVRGSFHVLWLPMVLGLWWFRDRFRLLAGAWMLVVVCLSLLGLLYAVAQRMGYLSERHALIVLLCGTYFAVAAVGVLGDRLALLLARLGLAGGRLDGRTLTRVLLLALAVAPLYKTLGRLHADRAGFRQAGAWLAAHTLPGDRLIDPYAWASYYAGRVFVEGQPDALPHHTPPVTYIVLENTPNRHPHLWWLLPEAERLAATGEVVQRFEVQRGKRRGAVCIYRAPAGASGARAATGPESAPGPRPIRHATNSPGSSVRNSTGREERCFCAQKENRSCERYSQQR
jgi:hypothetical protein